MRFESQNELRDKIFALLKCFFCANSNIGLRSAGGAICAGASSFSNKGEWLVKRAVFWNDGGWFSVVPCTLCFVSFFFGTCSTPEVVA